jgi:prolyl-tRNA synthetase
MLGTRFSDAFNLTYSAQDGSLQKVVMGCYGIGISRLMGIIAEATGDTSGLSWPAQVAPATVHIVAVAKTEDDEAFKKSAALYESLRKEGITCIFDDRLDQSVGSKLADADLIGAPYRALISDKSLKAGGVEVKVRASGEVSVMDEAAFKKLIVKSEK